MDEQLKGVKIENIYLSDLNTVLTIYKKVTEENYFSNNLYQENLLPFKVHVGLPLVLARYAQKVIGFAAVSFNELSEVEIKCFCVKEAKATALQRLLKEQAERVLHLTFDVDKKNKAGLIISIQRWSNWLNSCSE